MPVKLIALAAIAAGTFSVDQPAIAVGETFDLEGPLAEKAIEGGLAKAEELNANNKPNGQLKAEKPIKALKVRVLVDCAHGRANDVAELPSSAIKSAESDGLVDSSTAAVAYAMTLPQNETRR